MKHIINQAVKALSDGGIIIFPTDTAFGIGCRIDNTEAVDRLFRIRKRPLTQATPVLVASDAMALAYFDNPSDVVRRLMKSYWPGALTIIYYCKKDLIHSPIRGGTDTIGLRMPNHQAALEIIRRVGVPILGPSANFHNDPTPYTLKDLDPELVKLVDFVVPGECHAERDPASRDSVGMASTVVDCTANPYRILRQGVIALQLELTIDTSSRETITVKIIGDGIHSEKTLDIGKKNAQMVLPLIEEILNEQKLKLSDITAISVNTGPGSFTGLRVGVAVANTLATLLAVPLNGKSVGTLAAPQYEPSKFD